MKSLFKHFFLTIAFAIFHFASIFATQYPILDKPARVFYLKSTRGSVRLLLNTNQSCYVGISLVINNNKPGIRGLNK